MGGIHRDSEFKRMAVEKVIAGATQKEVAKELNIPASSLEEWVLKYKNNNNIDYKSYIRTPKEVIKVKEKLANLTDYSTLTNSEKEIALIQKDIEIERLKKNYQVTNTMGKKEYITYSEKNMK